MKRIVLRLALAACLVASVPAETGCGSTPGPVTWGNVVNNYPPKPRAVYVNLQASLVIVDYQPRNADVSIQGWFMVPSDPEGTGRRWISFTNDSISGNDNQTGRGQFVISSYDWPYGSYGDFAMRAGVTYYFMVTIRDGSGRTSVSTWQYANGTVTPIA